MFLLIMIPILIIGYLIFYYWKKSILKTIFNHDWFANSLADSWNNTMADEKNPKLFTCGRTCGTSFEFSSVGNSISINGTAVTTNVGAFSKEVALGIGITRCTVSSSSNWIVDAAAAPD